MTLILCCPSLSLSTKPWHTILHPASWPLTSLLMENDRTHHNGHTQVPRLFKLESLEGKHTHCVLETSQWLSGKPWTAGVLNSRSCQHRQGCWTLDGPVRRPSSCDRCCWMQTWVAICMNLAGWEVTVRTWVEERGERETDANPVPVSPWTSSGNNRQTGMLFHVGLTVD